MSPLQEVGLRLPGQPDLRTTNKLWIQLRGKGQQHVGSGFRFQCCVDVATGKCTHESGDELGGIGDHSLGGHDDGCVVVEDIGQFGERYVDEVDALELRTDAFPTVENPKEISEVALHRGWKINHTQGEYLDSLEVASVLLHDRANHHCFQVASPSSVAKVLEVGR